VQRLVGRKGVGARRAVLVAGGHGGIAAAPGRDGAVLARCAFSAEGRELGLEFRRLVGGDTREGRHAGRDGQRHGGELEQGNSLAHGVLLDQKVVCTDSETKLRSAKGCLKVRWASAPSAGP